MSDIGDSGKGRCPLCKRNWDKGERSQRCARCTLERDKERVARGEPLLRGGLARLGRNVTPRRG